MSKFKVLVSNPCIPTRAFEILKEKCLVTTHNLPTFLQKEGLNKLNGFHGILWFSKTSLNSQLLDAIGPQLRVISSMSVGFDNIDVEEVKKRGIQLSNVSQISSASIAEMAVFLTLGALRRYGKVRQAINNGEWLDKWDANWLLGKEIRNSNIGIVGLGNVGEAVAKRLAAFEPRKIYYCGPIEKSAAKKLNVEFITFYELLRLCDIILITCRLNNETRGLFNAKTFDEMEKGSVLINVARGEIIHTPSLLEALEKGTLWGAGIDVCDPEPLPPDHELFKSSNCILTPHIASATVNTRRMMAELAARNLLLGLGSQPLLTPV